MDFFRYTLCYLVTSHNFLMLYTMFIILLFFLNLLQCADSFLFVYTFLPMRFIMALISLITRPLQVCFGYVCCTFLLTFLTCLTLNLFFLFDYSSAPRPIRSRGVLAPAEICDILKAFILITCSMLMFYIDTSMMYHLIKSQSVIKLYIFYNMLEVIAVKCFVTVLIIYITS